jgi:hypothetical protein
LITAPPIGAKIQKSAGVSSIAPAIAAATCANVASGSVLSVNVCAGANPRCVCASLMPGITRRPPASMTSVFGPTSA